MFTVNFQENGSEYSGSIVVHCTAIKVHEKDDRIVYADHVRIEIDERIISVEDQHGEKIWENNAL